MRSVAGPDASGTQTLAVAIPENINSNYYGAFTLYVLTQGRKGSASVTVTNAAALSNVSPLEGFAPAASFNGSPFPGTAVRLQGPSSLPATPSFSPRGIRPWPPPQSTPMVPSRVM